MPTSPDVHTPEPVAAETEPRAKASRRAADALLREHPDAMVFAQTSEGHIVPLPESLGLEGYPVLADEGRTGVDLCVAEDRMTVVNAWIRLKNEAVAEARARLRSDPGQWRTVRMLDLRKTHGVVLSIVWINNDEGSPDDGPAVEAPSSTAPRFCSRKQDKEGNVLDCDDAYLQMFGYDSREQVIGQPTFERVHPDDQARLIESWIAMVATGRVQMSRIRVRCQDERWLWVDTTYHNFLNDDQHGYVLAECIDVSAEMVAQEELQDREELLRRLLEEMPDGLLQLDSERGVIYHNARLLEIFDGAEQSVHTDVQPRGNSVCDLESLVSTFTSKARITFDQVIERALAEGLRSDVELDVDHGPAGRRHILVKVRPLVRETGLVTGIIVSVQDVTDSARARLELEKRATLDSMTGAFNRSSIIAALTAELDASDETGVVYVDLDRFKAVNDSLGHAAGDELLVQVADRLKGAMRTNDELGRLGGDEFLILLRGVSGLGVALGAAERISHALRSTYDLGHANVELCASVGVACVRGATVSAEQLIERADAAMYRSKQQRGGTPVLAGAA